MQLGSSFAKNLRFSANFQPFGNFCIPVSWSSDFITMPSPKVQNYLRANRKRLALSQSEVAFLLGVPTATKVSRHEQVMHAPTLEAALAYEVIFKRPVSEIFGNLYKKVELEVADRARVLAERNNGHARDTLTDLAEINQ